MESILYKLLITFCAICYTRSECIMEGVSNWLLPNNSITIMDTDREREILRRWTQNIEEITGTVQGEGLNGGPYLDVVLEGSDFVISTNAAFNTYENHETALAIGLTIPLRCASGSIAIFVITIHITDTNNHSPEFEPSSNYEFTIAPPVPPGFLVTDCINDILIRDVDLTTFRIDYVIEGSPLFEITYDESSSVPKEFKAVLRTVTLIRSITEPITLRISATDVDETGDPQRTALGTITIIGNSEFEFPDEPIFSQAFYLAAYTETNQIELQDTIYLRQGFDDEVNFSLDGELKQYFEIEPDSNQITLRLLTSIPLEEYPDEGQTYLVVSAEREYTSGAMATVIVQFPKARELRFENLAYNGTLEDNIVTLQPIVLITDVDTTIELHLDGDYSEHFATQNTNNQISINVGTALPESALLQNDFLIITLSATASNALTTYTTIFLNIIKDDLITPTFSENIYYGRYIDDFNVEIDNILVTQGLDETVTFEIEDGYDEYFEIQSINNGVSVQVKSPIPKELIFQEKVVIFNILAKKPRTVGANAALSISFPDELILPTVLMFSKNVFNGELEENTLQVENIVLESGYTSDTRFNLKGEYEPYFTISNDSNVVFITMAANVAYEDLFTNKFVALEIEASGERSISVTSTVIIDILSYTNTMTSLVFENAYYSGSLDEQNRLDFTQIMSLRYGFDDTVQFNLEGEHNAYFTLVHTGTNSISVALNEDVTIPDEVIQQNTNLIFTITASKPETNPGRATIIIDLSRDVTVPTVLKFSQNTYNGQLEDNSLTVDRIILESGYSSDTQFTLNGEHRSYFGISNDENVVSITMTPNAAYEELMNNKFVVLEVEASGERSISVSSTVVIDILSYTNTMSSLVFENAYYTGTLIERNRLEFTQRISLRYGFDDTVQFNLVGEHDEWFTIVHVESNSLLIDLKEEQSVPEAIIQQNRNLIFTLIASKLESYRGQAVIVIDLLKDNIPESSLAFAENYYTGYIHRGIVTLDSISLEPHPDDVILEIIGENGIIKIETKEDSEIEFELNVLVFVLEARTVTREARTIIILEIKTDNETGLSVLKFSEPFYVVLFSESEGLVYNFEIILSDGYDDTVRFSLEGDAATWFSVDESQNPVAFVLSTPLPNEVIQNNNFLILVIIATNSENIITRATIVIELISDSSVENIASFDKVLYIGQLQDNVVRHELITLSNHEGLSVHLSGEYSELFNANNVDGVVTVTAAISVTIPDNLSIMPLELNAAEANSVLLLTVTPSDQPVLPTVTFSSSSYTLRTDVSQTGTVGRVQATADNGEPITYTLVLDDEHLRERLSVNNEGEISLSAPAVSGGYSFQVTATTIVNRASATAEVSLWVDAVTVCETDKVLPPLIVIERLEEEPHRNLVILDHEGCEYTLTHHWPTDQNWLYVDNEGLHTVAIDREHESIAFMAVSQVQVELVLECEGDTTSRKKRSLQSTRNHLGPYDYGSKSWILSDTILYNSRRSLVNLIVIDINDNNPVFVGKENEPIYVGYPTQELEETILPRSLVELKATDADIGENAAIVYWSAEENLAVASTTGFVHVRQAALLEDNSRFTIYAIDQNGRGLNGSIDIVVKLLDENHIAVLTIRDAFLDDERAITTELSTALGYDLKILKSVVISADTVTQLRKRREVESEEGVSLQLYLYGINQNSPVNVNQLTSDISNSNLITVNIARILSLEDHLQTLEICAVPGRDTALLAATISLAVLLFIIIIAIAVWFFLKWKKKPSYEQFSDVNSMASRNDSLKKIPKVESLSRPRLNRDELRKSEKRLQGMLNEEILKPVEQEVEQTKESIIDMPEPEQPEQQLPIVIQSIDKLKDNDDSDDDEFGEVQNKRRKSVVTFNENVEKIIHIEDHSDSISSDSDVEVYKF